MLEKPADPRFARSRAALITAMTALLDERDIGEITITELVERASVTRPTFYQHFSDLAAAARTASVVRLEMAFPLQVNRGDGPAGVEPVVEVENKTRDLLEHLQAHGDFYRRVIAGASAVELYDDLVKLLETRIMYLSRVDAGAADLTGISMDDRNTVLSGGLTWLIIRWLHSDFSQNNAITAMTRRLAGAIVTFAGGRS